MPWLLKILTLLSIAKELRRSIKDQSKSGQPQRKWPFIHTSPYREHPSEEEYRTAEQKNWLIQNRIAQRQIRWTRIAGIAAAIAAGFAYKGYVISVNNLQEARVQSDTARKALIATTRPWIKVTHVKVTSFQISKDRGFVWVDFTFKNVGNSPVQDVAIVPEILLPELQPNSIKEAHRICDDARGKPNAIIGNAAFPNEEPTQTIGFGKPMIDVIRGNEVLSHMFPQLAGYATFEIAGCVAYKFDGSPDVHGTSFVYTFRRNINHPGVEHGRNGNFFYIRAPQTFTADELEVVPDLLGRFAD